VRFKNDLSARFNYKRSRTLSMSFVDYQLSQTTREDITLGIGMRIKDFKLIPNGSKDKTNFNFDFGKTIPKNELDIKFEFSFQDDKTVNHVLDQNNSVATRGTKIIRISPSIDYAINNRLTVRIFYDFNRTIPAVSTSFPVTNSKAGVTVRFSLAQ